MEEILETNEKLDQICKQCNEKRMMVEIIKHEKISEHFDFITRQLTCEWCGFEDEVEILESDPQSRWFRRYLH